MGEKWFVDLKVPVKNEKGFQTNLKVPVLKRSKNCFL